MTVGSAVNDPKSGTLTAKTAPSEVNGPKDGTSTAVRGNIRGQGVFRRDLCQKRVRAWACAGSGAATAA